MLDIERLTEALAASTKMVVAGQIAPLVARLDALERKAAEPVDLKGEVACEAATLWADLEAFVKAAIDAIPAPQDGKSVTLDDVRPMIEAAIADAVKAVPAPKDGADGTSVRIEDVMPALAKRVEDFLAAIPAPEPGKPGKDGLGISEMFRAEGGRLIAVMSDGTTRDLGQFVGKDADPAQPGRDGLGFEDMEFVEDDYGRPVAKFQRGDVVKTVRLPCIIDRGPYKAGEGYIKGDAVSFGGSLWIAQSDTDERPADGTGWRLAARKGRDARDPKAARVG